jgi:hypothetical protein
MFTTRMQPASVVGTNVCYQEQWQWRYVTSHSSNWSAFSTVHWLWEAVDWFCCFKATVTWSIYRECCTAYRVQNITILLSATLNKERYVNTCTIITCYKATCFNILYHTVQYPFYWTSMVLTHTSGTHHSFVIPLSDAQQCTHETTEDISKSNWW